MLPEVPPDLAAKALQADVRNALTGVAQGDALPSDKRVLFGSVATGSASPEDILKKRRALLLHRYATAGRLSRDELAEIADLLPDARAIHQRVTTERYAHTLPHYENPSGYKVRNIKKWLTQGRTKTPADYPPLDDPAQMPAWWTRNMKRQVPARILAWASAATAPAPEQKPASARPASPAEKLPSPPAPSDAPLPARGYAAMLERALDAEQAAHQRMMTAEGAAERDDALCRMLFITWDKLATKVRELERDKGQILSGDNNYGLWTDFEASVEPKLNVLRQSHDALGMRLVTKLAMSAEIASRFLALYAAETTGIYDGFEKKGWSRPQPDEVSSEEFSLEAA